MHQSKRRGASVTSADLRGVRMRIYTVRERIGSGVLAVILLLTAILVSVILVSRDDMRTLATWVSALGAWGGVALFLKIALTGSSWAFFELRVGADSLAPDSRSEEIRNGTGRD